MTKSARRIGLALVLVGVGYAIGSGQRVDPDFELVVRSPMGETIVECQRGCRLAWAGRGVNPNATPTSHFSFACRSVLADGRCGSGTIAGWLER